MSTELVSCGSCERPYFATETRCPFCNSKPRGGSGVAKLFMGVMTPIVLAACYGGPGFEDDTAAGPVDGDADGWTSDVDCDDANADVNPDAVEDCTDTIDNDCDGKIDADDEDCASTEG